MKGSLRRTRRLEDVRLGRNSLSKPAPPVQSPLAPEVLDDADAGHSSLQFALHPAGPHHRPVVHVVDLGRQRPIPGQHRASQQREPNGRPQAIP
ncbi:hypothetical protein GSI_06032 [Ganoderma sinense ZZ0214-1]|uniref:Uncharacterized protein n=1 Tax=Ganoderma sinense ZZ0214-1 TaxID=1077348 RepID=A0A2G8SC50_9APHY|nr:hypothetical protein GSI_06032 [Ganoderma sinense ZZ0214-1]